MQSIARLRFGSITMAMQAREVLSRGHIASTVVRLRPEESQAGCGYGLELPRRDLYAASAILERAGMRHTVI